MTIGKLPRALVIDWESAVGAAAADVPPDIGAFASRFRAGGGTAVAIRAGEAAVGELFDAWTGGAGPGDARASGVDPGEALLVAGGAAEVAAGRAAGFAAVIGLARGAGAARMRAEGADAVVADLGQLDLRVLRRRRARRVGDVPVAAGAGDLLDGWLARRRPAVFLDYDGTLTPIVADPDAAILGDDMRAVVAELADRVPVAVVSGRDRADVERRVGLRGLSYAGGHGFDIAGPDGHHEHPGGVSALPALDAAERALRGRLGDVTGAFVERKRFSIAVHYRHVAPERVAEVTAAVRDASRPGLKRSEGKKVVELVPDVDWHKGRAVTWLLEELDLDRAEVVPMFLGDDQTDENAFRSLGGDGVGVLVGDPGSEGTYADLRVAGVGDVGALLRRVAARAGD